MTREEFKQLQAEREALNLRLRPLEIRESYERQARHAATVAQHPAAWVEIQVNSGGDRGNISFRVFDDPTVSALFTEFLNRFAEALRQRWDK